MTLVSCHYCGIPVPDTHQDHVWPVSLGGTDDPGNVVACCTRCNSAKGQRDPREWLANLPRRIKAMRLEVFAYCGCALTFDPATWDEPQVYRMPHLRRFLEERGEPVGIPAPHIKHRWGRYGEPPETARPILSRQGLGHVLPWVALAHVRGECECGAYPAGRAIA